MSCGYVVPSCGSGRLAYSGGVGGGVSASSLAVNPASTVGCITQGPCSEVVMQPSSFYVICPGPIMSASSIPVRVAGYSACATGGSGGSGGVYYGGSGGVSYGGPYVRQASKYRPC